jgi:hypothetical protein
MSVQKSISTRDPTRKGPVPRTFAAREVGRAVARARKGGRVGCRRRRRSRRNGRHRGRGMRGSAFTFFSENPPLRRKSTSTPPPSRPWLSPSSGGPASSSPSRSSPRPRGRSSPSRTRIGTWRSASGRPYRRELTRVPPATESCGGRFSPGVDSFRSSVTSGRRAAKDDGSGGKEPTALGIKH